MALKLMYITNNERIAKIAESSGVDWIFIDLEINGKEKRQGHLDTVISRHHISDVKRIKNVLTNAKLLVRINPIYDGSEYEIDKVVNDGADIIMLPYFSTKDEVEVFIELVRGRAKVCLLCETQKAVDNIDDILELNGIDYIHIGLNDLHLNYNKRFMFELLTDGTVEMLSNKFKAMGIPYGFGGIARIGQGILPAEYVIAEHYRLGSNMAILSRSFYRSTNEEPKDEINSVFENGVREIRDYENLLLNKGRDFFKENQSKIEDIVKKQVELIGI
ncbi:aldolase/citrate lyase family protein [Neobacillus niacini]|uniref:aldolase/citrate lyase family protein n=1 Tax=Neobacillus niacini TaxID=86668 RepID=UPI0005ED67A0|nr:aldolase/citrate lyase family protein [Neobacillus niacini]